MTKDHRTIRGRTARLDAISKCENRNEIARLMSREMFGDEINYVFCLDWVDGIQRAALTNAKPVDHAPLRDEPCVKCLSVDETGTKSRDISKTLECRRCSPRLQAALQPSVINKHDERMANAWKVTREYLVNEAYAQNLTSEYKPFLEKYVEPIDAALQPINQAEE